MKQRFPSKTVVIAFFIISPILLIVSAYLVWMIRSELALSFSNNVGISFVAFFSVFSLLCIPTQIWRLWREFNNEETEINHKEITYQEKTRKIVRYVNGGILLLVISFFVYVTDFVNVTQSALPVKMGLRLLFFMFSVSFISAPLILLTLHLQNKRLSAAYDERDKTREQIRIFLAKEKANDAKD